MQFGQGGHGVAGCRRRPPASPGRHVAAATAKASTARSAAAATVTEGLCTAPAARRALAAQLSADIGKGLRGRNGVHAVSVYDRVTGVYCLYNGSKHFDSASIVKAIIMAALLRWHQETKTPLSSWEKSEATLMITQSDNDAATDLWDELGMDNLQHFLNLADMGETQLGQDGEWGLTQVTAHDEMLLLKLLTAPELGARRLLALLRARSDGPGDQLGGMGRHGRHAVRRHLAREERLAAGRHRLAHQ